MNIGWNFPSSNYGTIKGISEAGIETFRGNLFQSLAKEICQNSLDARVNMDKPVKLEFMLTSVPKCEIDGFGELYKAMALCKDYWKDNIKAFRFFSEAVKTCENEFLRVLRISDFNTTGLTGSNEYKSSPWQNLVKSSGVSDKNGISGGSYGIGKSAPFACSDLRTVYYSTLDNEGVQAYQGVANLASFKLEDKLFKEGGVTQGTGYYGDKKTNAAVHTQFPMGGFIREESGTDIYILGFIKSEEWKDDIVKAILEGYLIGILNEDIIVKVEDISIDKENLANLIERYKEDIPLTYNYYQVLTSKHTVHITENFRNLGNLSLYVLIQKDLRRKVLMSRSNGMKIFDKQNISGTIQFAGVCILEDEKLNAYFREMETPQHNNWEPERHPKCKEAKDMRSALFKFIKDRILEIGRETISDEMDAVGGGEIIPDIDTASDALDAKSEYISDEIKDFTMEKIENIKTNRRTQSLTDTDVVGENQENGILDNSGDLLANKYFHSDGAGVTNGEKTIKGNAILNNDGGVDIPQPISVTPLKMRLFVKEPRERVYHLSFTPSKNVSKSYIEIFVSGEQGNSKNVNVSSAISDTGEMLIYRKNRIFIGNITAGTNYNFDFSMNYDEVCSLEVLIYGYKI